MRRSNIINASYNQRNFFLKSEAMDVLATCLVTYEFKIGENANSKNKGLTFVDFFVEIFPFVSLVIDIYFDSSSLQFNG
jgi:hypothetical protein